MSDTKSSSPSRDPVPREAEAPAAASASTQQPVQGQVSAATQYWQGIAAAGRAAKPAAATPAEAATPGHHRRARL
jgi:hypothetical protein